MMRKLMSIIKNWMKPSYIKEEFLKATKNGWCYTKNNDEVIVSIPHLVTRLADQVELEPVEPVAPTNTVAPVLSGESIVGSTLSVTSGTWTGDDTITYAYDWKSSTDGVTFTSIGVTTDTYVLVESDEGKTFQVEVTATNDAGNDIQVSNNVGPIDAAADA